MLVKSRNKAVIEFFVERLDAGCIAIESKHCASKTPDSPDEVLAYNYSVMEQRSKIQAALPHLALTFHSNASFGSPYSLTGDYTVCISHAPDDLGLAPVISLDRVVADVAQVIAAIMQHAGFRQNLADFVIYASSLGGNKPSSQITKLVYGFYRNSHSE